MYGVGEKWTDSFGRRCLLARRLVERGVRFVQIFLEEQPWDSHADLSANHRGACLRTDKPVAGLLRDLKQRGLLDSTLVVWGGEFAPHADNSEVSQWFLRTRPQHAGLYIVDGRRRNQRRDQLWNNR